MRKNKYITKNGGWGKNIIDAIEGFISDANLGGIKSELSTKIENLKSKIPDSDQLQTKAKQKIFEHAKSTIVDPLKDQVQQNRFVNDNKNGTNIAFSQVKLKQTSNDIYNAANNVVKNSPVLQNTIKSAAKIDANVAKSFVEMANIKLPKNITAKQIDKVFDSNAVLGLMATSKTTSELSHKIEAGLVLNKIYGLNKENKQKMT